MPSSCQLHSKLVGARQDTQPKYFNQLRSPHIACFAQCGFGKGSIVPATFVSSAKVRCALPASIIHDGESDLENVVLHVRHDGIHWSSHGGRISLFNSSKPFVVVSLQPSAVPVQTKSTVIATVINLHPASGLVCRFRSPRLSEHANFVTRTPATILGADLARCDAPQLSTVQQLSLSLSAEGASDGGVGAPLYYFDPAVEPVVLSASPSSGETSAGVLVTLRGTFGSVLLGKDIGSSGKGGGLDSHAAGASAAGRPLCFFGDEDAAATLTYRLSILCRAPRLATGEFALSLSLDGGQTRVASAVTYHSYDLSKPPVLTRCTSLTSHNVLEVAASDIAGGHVLLCSGQNFAVRTKMRCEFWGSGLMLGSVVASMSDPSTIRCSTPAVTSPSDARMRVSVDGGLSSSLLSFTFFDSTQPPTVRSISPRSAPLDETRSTVVQVSSISGAHALGIRWTPKRKPCKEHVWISLDHL